MSSTNLSLQPVGPIVVDNGMTMDEILAYSPKPRKGRGLARRHINIAFDQEAKDVLAEEFTYETPDVVSPGIPQFTYETPNVVSPGIPQRAHSNESTSYLVYSNGLLLTPEGELANQEDYNLSTEELNRQLKEHVVKNPKTPLATVDYASPAFFTEYADECIISVPQNTGIQSVFATPPNIPTLNRSECVRIDLPKNIVLCQ